MADIPTFAFGGLIGAVVASECGNNDSEWHGFRSLVSATMHEIEGVIQSASFIIGRAMCATRNGVEQLRAGLCEGQSPSLSILDKSDWDSTVDAGRKGTDSLLRGGSLAMQALFNVARITATRLMIGTEQTADVCRRNWPNTQEKVSDVWNAFLKGYRGTHFDTLKRAPLPSDYGPPATQPPQPHSANPFWQSFSSALQSPTTQSYHGASAYPLHQTSYGASSYPPPAPAAAQSSEYPPAPSAQQDTGFGSSSRPQGGFFW